MHRLVVLASGNGTNLEALLDATENGHLEATIVAVFVNRSNAQAQKRAQNHRVHSEYFGLTPYLNSYNKRSDARHHYDTDLAQKVASQQPDLVILAGWMHIFSMAFLCRFPNRVINLHPALPGEFPGATAINDAWKAHLQDGLERSGVMVHLVNDEGIDDGLVLATREVPITSADNRTTFEARMHAAEHQLLVAAVGDYLNKL
ncbi:MAG: phosphoribosylglycinamide formyltransferase [Acidimicrobiia bacterium]|nr:phosphoribosylglycinamide formyltransferase [Acidimicrobiia bacterium]MCY4456802.1 phosphoribosylglycinamide formyltransferase [Acidimicrobiaceae bacterium]